MGVHTIQNVSLSDDVLIDTETTSRLTGIPASTLSKWRSTGANNIPYVKIGGHVRYSTAALREYIERHSTGGAK